MGGDFFNMKLFFLFLFNSILCAESFRDLIEISERAPVRDVESALLKKQFYKHKKTYHRFYKETFDDFLKLPVGIQEATEGKESIVVSLTSYPPRIETAFITIESLLRQDTPPNKIILYLSEAEFPEKQLPETLTFQQTRGLEIRWVKENLKYYKKNIYALKEFPTSLLVTVDDDSFYDQDMLHIMLQKHEKHPEAIIANFYLAICVETDGSLAKVQNYLTSLEEIKKNEKRYFLLSGGGGGTLYPKNCFNDIVFDKETFLKYIPSDDFWIFACGLANNRRVIEGKPCAYPKVTDMGGKSSLEYSRRMIRGMFAENIFLHNAFLLLNLYEKLGIKPNKKLEGVGLTAFDDFVLKEKKK